jgi:flagellar protein FlaJ
VRVRRDIAVTDDVAGSLIALSRRLRVASIARSLHIVARGSRYTNDLGDVLAVTGEDLRNRHRLQRERRAQMRLYTVVFVLGVLIYLGIVVMLNRYLFPPLLEVAAAEEFQNVGVLSIGTAQGIEAYRVAFFHSALLQVAGTSMVVGRLERNDILSGLKYANVLAVVVVAVFLLL